MARRVLDPVDRISEVLFGLIMALTFTGSLSAAESGRADVKMMLIGALGCNLAWGLVDAVMFLMSSLIERSRGLLTLRKLRETADPAAADAILSDLLPPVVSGALSAEQRSALGKSLASIRELPSRAKTGKDDWLGAAGVFLLVFISTFPLAIPFIFIADVQTAMRVSNAVAIVMLFLCGYNLGQYAARPAWRTGMVMVLLGVVLVGITMALGG